MEKSLLGFRSTTIAAFLMLAAAILVAFNSHGQTVHKATSKQYEALTEYLRHFVGNPNSDTNRATQYSAAFVDLVDNGVDDAIVYLSGDGWCGSGGCTMLVLIPQERSYKLVARLMIARPPIRVLTKKSHGWYGIAFWMQGGGIQPGYEAEFSFNGKTYVPDDKATLRPSERVRERVLPGIVAISTTAAETGRPLYP